MPVTIDPETYLVRKPLYEIGKKGVGLIKGRQLPTMTYMSNAQVPGSNTYIEHGWIYTLPEPNPHIREHVHPHDEIVMHFGNDPDDPQDLGAEMEMLVDGQTLPFDTNMAIFVPAGVKHTPVVWKSVKRPHVEMSITLRNGNYGYAGRGPAPAVDKPLWHQPDSYDFSSHLVAQPRRDPAAGGRPLTYMSEKLVPGCRTEIELGWIRQPSTSPGVGERGCRHDTIELFIGSDPEDPEALGATVEYVVDGKPLVFDRAAALFVPQGTRLGPVTWKQVDRPHLHMTMRLETM